MTAQPTPLASLIHAVNTKLIGQGDLGAIPSFFAPDYVAHLTDQDMDAGHAAIRQVIALYRRVFPDLRVRVEILVEAGDRVAWQRTLQGTQQSAFQGFPATGRSIVWREMVTSRIANGLIAEEWVLTDLAEQLLLARKGRN